MFKVVTKYNMGKYSKFNPEYKVICEYTQRILGFGSLNECNIMCDALNNKYYPVTNYNSDMKNLLRNED